MIGKHVDILLIKQQRLSMSKHPLDTQLPTVDALFCTGTHPRDSLTNIAKPPTFSNFLEIRFGPCFRIGEKKYPKLYVQIQELTVVNATELTTRPPLGFPTPRHPFFRCHTCQFVVDLGQDFFGRQLIHQSHYLGGKNAA
jgi:hypothetical protein